MLPCFGWQESFCNGVYPEFSGFAQAIGGPLRYFLKNHPSTHGNKKMLFKLVTLDKHVSVDHRRLPYPTSLHFLMVEYLPWQKLIVLCSINIQPWKDFYTSLCLFQSIPWEPNSEKPIKEFWMVSNCLRCHHC